MKVPNRRQEEQEEKRQTERMKRKLENLLQEKQKMRTEWTEHQEESQ